ncbi:MAG: 3-hydroxyisobutyrate dehydrogenase [Thermoleophilaceae bacterium]|jgi:3-hydroxyisobutyrate dehydrogenase|nr:3-hydroxyisobutyrate dehydrogenase [Thermoleophilaceae bacterium]
MSTVAVLGAGGTMGLPMARNLAGAGHDVRAWNRTRASAEPLAEHGVAVVHTPAEAAAGADVIVTILTDADAVVEAMADVRGPAVWAQMSTVGLDGAERVAALARERDLKLVDAPVLGTKAPAEAGELIVLASGPEDLRPAVEPIFDAVGKVTRWAGEEPGAGQRLKVAINAWIMGVMETAAETLALAEGLGVDPREVLDTLSGGPLDLPYLQTKGRMIAERSFEPSMKLSLAAKDVRLIVEAAEAHGLDLPLFRTIRDRMAEGAEEHGELDMAASFLTSAPGS